MNSEIASFVSLHQKPLIVILGPTASGKTGYSIELAHHIQDELDRSVEVINADSRQLYRYLNIGTAKITEEEMQGVPHHLIDVLDPNEEATAGWYQTEAQKCIDQLHDEEKVPLLVGGSMLYISAIIDGLSMAPEADPVIRKRLLDEYEQDNGRTLHQRLQEIDPEAAERIHPNNQPRLVRAVEIFELTQQPKSDAVPQSELRQSSNTCPYDLHIIGMQWEREALCERINQRCQQMFDDGWVEEVQDLLSKGYTADDPAMKSHGYREIISSIECVLVCCQGEKVRSEKLEVRSKNLEQLQEEIAAKTRQYARRQMSWWKGDERIHWLQFPSSR